MNEIDRKSLIKFYGDIVESYFDKYQNEVDEKPFDQDFLNLMSSQIPKELRVLDIGCGATCQSARYLSRAHRVEAIDIVPENIACAQKYFPNLALKVMDFTMLEYEDESFGGIAGFYCLGHIPSKERRCALLELRRVLNKGGVLAIVVHRGTHDKYKEDGTYFKSFDVNEITKELIDVNFRIISIQSREPFYAGEGALERIYILAVKI